MVKLCLSQNACSDTTEHFQAEIKVFGVKVEQHMVFVLIFTASLHSDDHVEEKTFSAL